MSALAFVLLAAFAAGFLSRSLLALAREDGLDGEKRILAGGVEVIQLGRRGAALHALIVMHMIGLATCFVAVASFFLGAMA